MLQASTTIVTPTANPKRNNGDLRAPKRIRRNKELRCVMFSASLTDANIV